MLVIHFTRNLVEAAAIAMNRGGHFDKRGLLACALQVCLKPQLSEVKVESAPSSHWSRDEILVQKDLR